MNNFGVLALVVMSSFVPAVAIARECARVCDEVAHQQCMAHWKSVVEGAKYGTLPHLDRREQELPALIGACAISHESLNTQYANARGQLGQISGRVEANERTQAGLSPILAGLSRQEASFRNLRPLIEESVPLLVLQVRGHLTRQEIQVDLAAADLIDRAQSEVEPERRAALLFQAEAWSDLKVLRELVGNATRVDELVRAAFGSRDGRAALELLSPFTRSIVSASHEAQAAWQIGAEAFRAIEVSWTEAEVQLQTEIARVDEELRLDRQLQLRSTEEVGALEGAVREKRKDCVALQVEKDSGIAEGRAQANAQIDGGGRQFQGCGSLHCRRTECNDYGRGL